MENNFSLRFYRTIFWRNNSIFTDFGIMFRSDSFRVASFLANLYTLPCPIMFVPNKAKYGVTPIEVCTEDLKENSISGKYLSHSV